MKPERMIISSEGIPVTRPKLIAVADEVLHCSGVNFRKWGYRAVERDPLIAVTYYARPWVLWAGLRSVVGARKLFFVIIRQVIVIIRKVRRGNQWVANLWGWFNPSTQWCRFCGRYEHLGKHLLTLKKLTEGLMNLQAATVSATQAIKELTDAIRKAAADERTR